MIVIYTELMTNIEAKELIEYYENNIQREYTEVDKIYRYKGIDITGVFSEFSFLKKIGLQLDMMDRIRIQRVDNTINMVEHPHTHFEPYSFVSFLNDNFTGGELVFDNITIQPKKNQLVYFTKNERHLVKNVSEGYRYTLVCFLKKDLFKIMKIDKLI